MEKNNRYDSVNSFHRHACLILNGLIQKPPSATVLSGPHQNTCDLD